MNHLLDRYGIPGYAEGGEVTDVIQGWWKANEGRGDQAALDRWLATSGYTPRQISVALPFLGESDLESAIASAQQKYPATQAATAPAQAVVGPYPSQPPTLQDLSTQYLPTETTYHVEGREPAPALTLQDLGVQYSAAPSAPALAATLGPYPAGAPAPALAPPATGGRWGAENLGGNPGGIGEWWARNDGTGTQADLDWWLANTTYTPEQIAAQVPILGVNDLYREMARARAQYAPSPAPLPGQPPAPAPSPVVPGLVTNITPAPLVQPKLPYTDAQNQTIYPNYVDTVNAGRQPTYLPVGWWTASPSASQAYGGVTTQGRAPTNYASLMAEYRKNNAPSLRQPAAVPASGLSQAKPATDPGPGYEWSWNGTAWTAVPVQTGGRGGVTQ